MDVKVTKNCIILLVILSPDTPKKMCIVTLRRYISASCKPILLKLWPMYGNMVVRWHFFLSSTSISHNVRYVITWRGLEVARVGSWASPHCGLSCTPHLTRTENTPTSHGRHVNVCKRRALILRGIADMGFYFGLTIVHSSNCIPCWVFDDTVHK